MPAMSDRPDIVDELREIASSAYKADDDNSRLREAADEIERLRDELDLMRSRGGDMARLRCPKCPPFMEAPTFRCIACGTGWWDDPEEVRDG
jgi:hypothetical protein